LTFLKDGLASLKNLFHLDLKLNHCLNITDAGFGNFAQSFKNLVSLQEISLDFYRCPSITDDSIRDLRAGLFGNKNLTAFSLDLAHCGQITNTTLRCIRDALAGSEGLLALQINFDSCKITDEGVDYLQQSIKKHTALEDLNITISNCHELTDKTIRRMRDAISMLKKLRNLVFILICAFIPQRNIWIL